ncbi:hypothetical protein SEMRO_2364_G325000.1 [Seminavis robusta]|uniref:Uncharacterized protein n=1 Tax=Seminavis robusta TaxID=568900 RepID=A0A9N8HVM2_9STRA|nr:hypothetical protein SEMRO_2364_G325000.1 [Seminavis robusta]|eukprot:Sro2364_g325000.1 n/a (101) ;mRNA; f:13012-13405
MRYHGKYAKAVALLCSQAGEDDQVKLDLISSAISSSSSHKQKASAAKPDKVKSTPTKLKKEKPTMSLLGSPVRILKGSNSSGSKDHKEFYDVDLSNEEMH